MLRSFLLILVASAHITLAQNSDNPALTKMFAVDQAARQGEHIDWAKLSIDDEQRRQDLRRLLEAGELHTGNDYFHAALIFQHGRSPGDYLVAHVLAMDAVALGNRNARWLAAATLDRYLLSVKQKQVFGTQFHSGPGTVPTTQEPMDAELVTDSMRATTCVTPVREQRAMLARLLDGGDMGSTSIPACK